MTRGACALRGWTLACDPFAGAANLMSEVVWLLGAMTVVQEMRSAEMASSMAMAS